MKNRMSAPTVLAALTAVLAIGVGGYYLNRRSSNQESFRELKIARGNLTVRILATGTVQPENRLEIKSPVAGRVDQVLVQEGDRVRKGQTLAWMSSTERAALVDAARAKGPEEVAKWEELYRSTPVVAPLVGTIIRRSVEPGQTFTSNDVILVMSDRLLVKAQVDETDLSKVKVGGKAEIVLDAYAGHTIPAQVTAIAYESKVINNVTTYLVEVLPAEVPDFMRAGMTANVSFLIDSRENALLVPAEAVRFTEQQSVETLVKPGETRKIEIGLTDGKFYEVLGGLAENDTVLAPTLKPKENLGTNPFSPMGGRPRGAGRTTTTGGSRTPSPH